MRLFLLTLVTLLGLASFRLLTTNLRADKTSSYIRYAAKHTLHSWAGISKNVDCIIVYDEAENQIRKVAATSQVVHFDSDNASRDSHALEVLEAVKYPKVTFVSSTISQKDSLLSIAGNLTFHGITKPISFTALRKDQPGKITVTGSFPVSLTAYNVERPSFMMIKTDDTLELTFHVVVNR